MNRSTSTLAIAAGLAVAGSAFAVPVVDGTLDVADYGAPDAVQNRVTGFGDNVNELNAAYSFVDATDLYLFYAGNLENNFNKLMIFIDSQAGGINNIVEADNPSNFDSNISLGSTGFTNGWQPYENRGLADSPAQAQMANFTFDAGFEADYVAFGRRGLGKFDFDFAILDQTATPADEIEDAFFGTEEGSSGPIVDNLGTGGTGTVFEVGFDNSNTGGVGGGATGDEIHVVTMPGGADDPEAVTTGFELKIPLSAIGNPTGNGDIKITAFINGANHDFMSNQFLGDSPNVDVSLANLGSDGAGNFLVADVNLDGVFDALDDLSPIPDGQPDALGTGLVDFSAVAGDQFYTIGGGPSVLLGDMNVDGLINFDDIDPFILGLTDPAAYTATYGQAPTVNGDINMDTLFNFDDIDPFIAILTGGPAVPEPASLALLGLGGLMALRRRR